MGGILSGKESNLKWFMSNVIAPIFVMLVGGYLYLEMTDLRKELKESFSSKVEENRQCHRMGETQICWGKLEQLSVPDGDEHTRAFSFTFSLPFSEVPVVTNGINSNSSGYAYAVYNYQASKTSYRGNIVEVEFRKNFAPVGMNYVAIGRWRESPNN